MTYYRLPDASIEMKFKLRIGRMGIFYNNISRTCNEDQLSINLNYNIAPDGHSLRAAESPPLGLWPDKCDECLNWRRSSN